MGSITETIPAQVEAAINYYRDPDHDGEDTFVPGSVAYHKRKYRPKTMTIKDIRRHEADFTLSKTGFQLIRHDLGHERFATEDEIKTIYPEVEGIVKNITGASQVKTFSHITRRMTQQDLLKEIEDQKLGDTDNFPKAPPAHHAHVDNGDDSAGPLLDMMVDKEEAACLKAHRWAIINFWKPLETVLRDPLAMCDFNTSEEEDFVQVYATPQGEKHGNFAGKSLAGGRFSILQARENPRHRWYYASRMQPSEALLIKIFDTNKSDTGKRQRTIHCAFSHKETEDAPARQSVEFRTMVFWADQEIM